jgi:endonuclease YncB( thermonuclease family)
MFEYNCFLLQVIDGDTLKLEIDLGFHLRMRGTFRLARLNAPELLSTGGMSAKFYVQQHLQKAIAMKVWTSRSEKYGRWLCELWFQSQSEPGVWKSLNKLLLDSGYAVPYRSR